MIFLFFLLPQALCASGQANVFIYHRFADPRFPSTDISTADFKAHLELLKQERFAVVTLGEVVDRLDSGLPLPERCAVISVDDAYRSFLTVAWPLLKSYGYPATLFVSTDSVGGDEFLSWQELRQLQDEGVEIGNHTASHGYLLHERAGEGAAAWAARVAEDIRRAQQALTVRLGKAPTLFAYPYGEFSTPLADLVKQLGFRAAFGQQSGVVGVSTERFRWPRFPVGGGYAGVEDFRQRLFMRPLVVDAVTADSRYPAGENPPLLRFRLPQESIEPASLRCFVPGQPECLVRRVAGDDGLYEARATLPLAEKRSKYTLTARDRQGRSWYWYSHLWVRAGEYRLAGQVAAG